jgi:MFS family permease
LQWPSCGLDLKFPSIFLVCGGFPDKSKEIGLMPTTGGVPPYIYGDIGGVDRWVWFVLANLLALAAVCPFVGALSDLLGRRYVALIGASFIVLGMIVCSTAHTMNIFICKLLRNLQLAHSEPMLTKLQAAWLWQELVLASTS